MNKTLQNTGAPAESTVTIEPTEDNYTCLTIEQATQLTEMLLCNGGIRFSATEETDERYSALLLLLKFFCDEEDAVKRENMYIDLENAVFRYTYAADRAAIGFLKESRARLMKSSSTTIPTAEAV